MKRQYNPSRKQTRRFRPLIFAAALLVLALALLGVLYATETFPFGRKQDAVFTAGTETKGESLQQTEESANPQTQDGSWPSDNKSQPNGNAPAPDAKLKKPDGNFVNNHRASLKSGESMQSSCMTTAAAMCQIIFTKDGVTKTLVAQKTDAGGGTYWTWTLKEVGLTAGSWTIQAKATLGSQTETTDDAIKLEISP